MYKYNVKFGWSPYAKPEAEILDRCIQEIFADRGPRNICGGHEDDMPRWLTRE